MTTAQFSLSAFGDEIADDLEQQLATLRDLRIGYLELRGVWKKNVLHLSDEEARQVKQICAAQGIKVSVIGSPIGKSPLVDPIAKELGNLRRIFQIGEMVGTQRVRIFSFYPPDTGSNTHYDQHLPEVIERLGQLTALARAEGFQLLLENERGIVGDTVARCQALLQGVNSPHLQFAWDPGNFVHVQGAQTVATGWDKLGSFVGHVHIKDGEVDGKKVCAAGEGDGQVDLLLARLHGSGYQGFLALEPHLAIAGHSSGFSGVDGMQYAVDALRKLLNAQGCIEVMPAWA